MTIQVSPAMEYVRRKSETGMTSEPATTSDPAAAARAAGMAAASASAAAGAAGAQQEQASASAMATASDAAAKPASVPTVAPAPTYTPPPAPAVAPKPAAPTTLDSNISSYLDNVSANLGKESYTTEAGKLYADRVTSGLQTPDASSVNAQATEDTAAARRAYLARVSAEERVGQSGFALGSAQATRIADQSQAGTNAANQAGQNAVNDYIRQRTELNMDRARGLERDQQAQNQTNLGNVQNQSDRVYGRGRDAVGDARYENETNYTRTENAADRAERESRYAAGDTQWEKTFEYGQSKDAADRVERTGRYAVEDAKDAQARADNLDQRNWEREQVIKGDDETAKRNLLNSLPEGPAKNVANQMLAQGKAPAEVMAAIFNPDGSIKEAYRGKSTVALGQEAIKEKAIATLQTEAAANGTLFDPNTPEGVRAVAARMMELQKTADAPITDAVNSATKADFAARLARGEELPEKDLQAAITAGVFPPKTVQQLPFGANAFKTFMDAGGDENGGHVLIDGTPFKVLDGNSYVRQQGTGTSGDRNADYVALEDATTGTKYWVDSRGNWFSAPPPKYFDNMSEKMKAQYRAEDPTQ